MVNGKSNPSFAFIWMALMGFVLHDATATLQTKFMEDLCYHQKSVKIDLRYLPTGILMSLPPKGSEEVFDCEVILSPPRESSVVVSIYKYDIGPNDTLTIEDSDRFQIGLTGYGNFKDEKKAIISEGKMVIRYQRNLVDKSLYVRQGFQLTFTSAKQQGPCYDNEFKCNNHLCILKEYVCDGHNHCGDRSDQKTCVPKDSKDSRVSNANQDAKFQRQNSHVLWISIIGVSGAIVFIIVVVFIIAVVRMRKPKAAPTPNSNNQNSGGSAPLQSVSSTVPQQQPQAPTADNAPSAPPAPEGFSFYNRVRRSLRGMRSPKPEDVSKEIVNSEVYQVPSMYPNLDQHEPAPSEGGIVNPEFKSEEP